MALDINHSTPYIHPMNKTLRLPLITILLACLGGCSLAPTSLSCGTESNASYVTLENLKDNNPQTIKNYAALCNFNNEAKTDET